MCVYTACSASAASTAEDNNVGVSCDGTRLLGVFSPVPLIGLEVNGVALDTNGHHRSSSADLNITVETGT